MLYLWYPGPGNIGAAAGRCLSFCSWLPSSTSSSVFPFRNRDAVSPPSPASTTFQAISRPEKSCQMWRVGGGEAVCAESVTKLTSIVNHRNRQFSRPSGPPEYWKPRLQLFASSDVNNSLTLENWLNAPTCRNLRPAETHSTLQSVWCMTQTSDNVVLVDEVRWRYNYIYYNHSFAKLLTTFYSETETGYHFLKRIYYTYILYVYNICKWILP